MKFLRKTIATVMVAAAFFWAPSAIPTHFSQPQGTQTADLGTCALQTVSWLPTDTAFAYPPTVLVPCYVPPKAPIWPVITGMLGAASVIVNSYYVGHTQCRELTSQEAWSSIFLPFIGIAFNQQNNQCGPHPQPHHGHH